LDLIYEGINYLLTMSIIVLLSYSVSSKFSTNNTRELYLTVRDIFTITTLINFESELKFAQRLIGTRKICIPIDIDQAGIIHSTLISS